MPASSTKKQENAAAKRFRRNERAFFSVSNRSLVFLAFFNFVSPYCLLSAFPFQQRLLQLIFCATFCTGSAADAKLDTAAISTLPAISTASTNAIMRIIF